MALSSVFDAEAIELPRFARADGAVVVAECISHVPFAVARMFTLRAPLDAVRGNHAHRRCEQFMLCANGAIDVGLDDGVSRRTVRLDRENLALHVPAMIWNMVTFRAADTVLIVLCDQPYREDDYIRDYAAFLEARRDAGA
ncbi:MAG: FdtA/QdtA family cupin domain-containing protein [Proteobacteria bacterium]|nr:FdtA/QdtA family cupin domain-containing protein [Pseudomonadota bacterium]